jgi:hypothetical protein
MKGRKNKGGLNAYEKNQQLDFFQHDTIAVIPIREIEVPLQLMLSLKSNIE